MKGFSTSTPKMVENKFVVGEETPELLDDWDQRTVTSVLEFHEAVEAPGKPCCKFQSFKILHFNKKCSGQVNCPLTMEEEHRRLVLLQYADKEKVIGHYSVFS